MTARARLLLGAGVVVLPFLVAPLVLRPTYAFAVVVAAVAVALAVRSVALPVALAGVPSVAIGLTHATLPTGAVAEGLALWMVLAIGVQVVRGEAELPLRFLGSPPVYCTALLVVWLLIRLGASADPAYGSHKLQLFVAQDLVLLVAGIMIARRADRTSLWALVTLVVAVLGALTLLRGLVAGHAESFVGGRYSLTGKDSPIALGRDSAEGILIAISVLLASRRAAPRLVALAAIPLLAISFGAAGSRGPVVALLVGLAVLLGLSLGEPRARRRVLLVAAAVCVAAAVVPQVVPGNDLGRTFSILSGGAGLSSNGRSALWSRAWSLFAAHPAFGVGTGSFHALGGGVEYYPHNLFLEAAAELGLVGLLLVAGVVGSTLVGLRRLVRVARGPDREHAVLVCALFAAALVNAMFSGDITDNDAVWLTAGLALGLGVRGPLELALAGPRTLLRRRRGEAGSSAGSLDGPGPEPSRPVDPAKLLAPADGSRLSGTVRAEVLPSRSGSPVATIRLEWNRGAGWQPVAQRDERTYEVVVGGEVAAVVRSFERAHAVAEALAAELNESRRRPWVGRPSYVVEWRIGEMQAGPGRLRAVTVDLDGRESATAPVDLVTAHEPEPAAPAEAPEAAPPPGNAGPAGELAIVGLPRWVSGTVALDVRGVEAGEAIEAEVSADGGEWRRLPVVERELDTSLLPDGRWGLRVTAGASLSPPVWLTVDNVAPQVRLGRPSPGAVVSGTVVFEAETSDAGSGVERIDFERYAEGAWHPVEGGRWETADADDGEVSVRVVAADRAGNVSRTAPVTIAVRNRWASGPGALLDVRARPTLDDYEALIERVGDPIRGDALHTLLYALESYAYLDGTLPPQFDSLLEHEFGDLLDGPRP